MKVKNDKELIIAEFIILTFNGEKEEVFLRRSMCFSWISIYMYTCTVT